MLSVNICENLRPIKLVEFENIALCGLFKQKLLKSQVVK
jgi:hypothetical protein